MANSSPSAPNSEQPNRVTARLSLTEKQLLSLAASIEGYKTLNPFVVKAALDRAKAVIEAHERLSLNEAATTEFFNAMLNPPKPNTALAATVKMQQEAKQDDGDYRISLARPERP